MKQSYRWALLALVAIITSSSPAQALSTLVFSAAPVTGGASGGPQGRIYAGADAVLTIAGHGDHSLADAHEITRRLNLLTEQGIGPQDLAITKAGKAFAITARGRAVITIDRTMAKAHATTPEALAKAWLDNLAAQFGRPYLSAASITVPVGESRALAMRGNIAGVIQVQLEEAIATAFYEAKARAVRVIGVIPGTTDLVITDGKIVLRLPIRVARYAGRIAARLTAEVTGHPASGEVVHYAAEAAVRGELILEPGAWASVDAAAASVGALGTGRARSFQVSVVAAGEDYLRYQANPLVTIHNEPAPEVPAEVLMVSNSPERLHAHGLWYEGALNEQANARLLYHHVNNTGVASDFIVELWNVGDQPTRVQLISGVGGPSKDEAFVGHRAAKQFLGRLDGNTGWIVTLPPKTAVPVFFQRMGEDSTLSGIMELRRLEAGDVRVRCYLEETRSIWLPYDLGAYEPSPVLGKWIYPAPQQDISARYVVGREWAFVTIGHPPVNGIIDGEPLQGNYGVIYHITFELVNPYEQPATVELRMEAGGGTARAALRVNGQPMEVAMLRRNEEPTIARYVLGPGETRTVHLETTPQGGSNYPVRVFARMM